MNIIEALFQHRHRNITCFVIRQQRKRHHLGEHNHMNLIAPGNTCIFTATPIPAGAVPQGSVPSWTSSDTTNAPVTADATGLSGTVAIPSSAQVGASFTLGVSYTNPDGVVATGSASFTIVAPPQPDITGFTIEQTA